MVVMGRSVVEKGLVGLKVEESETAGVWRQSGE